MITILHSIFPIFILIALGKWISRSQKLPADFFKGLNTLTFRFLMPALLIDKISRSTLTLDAFSRTFLVLAAGTILALLIALILAKPLHLTRPQTGAFIQGAFRGNTAFIGLPLIAYALGDTNPEAVTLATVVFGPGVVMFNLLAVATLLHFGSERVSGSAWKQAFLGLLKNPLILGCLGGFALQLLPYETPLFLARSLKALGQGALPLALLSIGADISFEKLQGAASPSFVAALIKVILAPLIGWLIAPLFGLNATERVVSLLMLACPTAVTSYVMAEVLNNDAPIAGRIVIISTLISLITLPLILLIGTNL
jgi:malate permease and related proteins